MINFGDRPARLGRVLLRGSMVILLMVAACDSGPSGPGTLEARVRSEGLGAAVLEVEGAGIQGFAGRGSTQVYSGPVPGRTDVYRVIVVDPVGGDIGFEIQVDDVGMDGPILTVITAARTDNGTMAAAGVAVGVER